MQWKRTIQMACGSAIIFFSSYAFSAPLGGTELPASTLPENVSRSIGDNLPQPGGVAAPISGTSQESSDSALTEEAKKIKFQLNAIILEGNKVYTTAQLQFIYQSQLKKTISVADLFTIVQHITNYYRNNGYIISRAILPPQRVKNGVVKIKIIEGYIGDVIVPHYPTGATTLVRAYGEQIKRCPPLHLTRLEKYLLYANEIPATSVKAVLSPAKKKIGAADLTLMTETKPVTGYFSYDNYGTRYIGPQQLTGNIGLNSLLAAGDSTQFTLSKTPKGKELTYTDLNYNLPVSDEGMRWLIGGTRATTHPLYFLQPVNIAGLTQNYYTTLSLPWIRTRTTSLTFQASFNYNDSEVTTFDELLYRDHIRSIDMGLIYNTADRWAGLNLLTADIKQGLPILGYTSDTNINTALTSRPGGHANYTKIVLQLSRLQSVTGPWFLYGILRGQWAFNPLLASEQFSFGGSQLGRGYDVSEIIGDKGAAASLELRYNLEINRLFIQTLQLYTFYDAGMIWNYNQIGDERQQESATSFGLGTRFFLTKYISGNIMWTKNLTKPVEALQLIREGNRPRVFFSIIMSYD